MREIILILFFNISIIFFGPLRCYNSLAQKQNSQEQITKMLKNLYINIATIHDLHKLDSIKRLNCTSNYYKEIENQEMLDYEPLIKAQDFGVDCLKTLTINKDSKRDNLYYVSYIEPTIKKKVTIRLVIVKEKDLYKIEYVFLDGI
jgi:hypothetical protein